MQRKTVAKQMRGYVNPRDEQMSVDCANNHRSNQSTTTASVGPNLLTAGFTRPIIQPTSGGSPEGLQVVDS